MPCDFFFFLSKAIAYHWYFNIAWIFESLHYGVECGGMLPSCIDYGHVLQNMNLTRR